MFEPIIRWFRLNVPGCEYLWFILNRRRLKRDFEAFKARVKRYEDEKGGSE